MTDYADSTALATYMGVTLSTAYTNAAPLALTAASRAVDAYTGRDFSAPTTASTMQFEVRSLYRAFIRDASTINTISLDTSGDGTPDITLTTADYTLFPLNQYINGISGLAAYTEIRLHSRFFPDAPWFIPRPPLYVNAVWGWAAIPDVIKRATMMLAAEMLKDPETPWGVAGFDQAGVVRVRSNPRVAAALQPFIRNEQAVMCG